MAFTDFTSIAQVQETFDIKYVEEEYIRYDVDIEPSPAFLEEFTFSQQHIDVFASETSRCENVIYPILRDVYKKYADRFSLWSHKSIAYDVQLSGTPDYLISTKSALGKTVLGTPIIISCCISPIFYKPPQLITEDYCVKEDLAFRTEMNGKQISESEMEGFYEKFCQTFSLACNLAVQFSLNWKFLAEDELFNLKFGYIIGRNLKQFGNSNYGSLIEHPQSKIDQAKSLYESLEKLNSNVREKLQIPINRWIKSKTSTNPVDKIIDLGIALESLYLPKNNVEQLSFQFRLHAAWHLSKDKADRKMLIDEFKAIYTLRSKAVHNGEVPDKIKIRKGEEPIATTTFISKAQDLCRDSIIKIRTYAYRSFVPQSVRL